MTSIRSKIVAVDGPAGSGKSSICKSICQKLEFDYINTGALYRAIGVLATRNHIDYKDEQSLCDLVESFSAHYRWNPKNGDLFFKNENISHLLYQETAGQFASSIALLPLLRDKLLPIQRKLAEETEKGALLDGRDIGTVVFPNADIKIFMTASLKQRAKRRLSQLQEKENSAILPSLEEMMEEIKNRDDQDTKRTVAPLKKASDAIIFDNTNLSIEESIEGLLELIREKLALN